MPTKELNVLLQAIIRAAGQTYATVSEPIQVSSRVPYLNLAANCVVLQNAIFYSGQQSN